MVARVLPDDGAARVRQDLVAHVGDATGSGPRLQLAQQHRGVVAEAVGGAQLQTAGGR